MQQLVQIAACGGGIIASLVLYSILQVCTVNTPLPPSLAVMSATQLHPLMTQERIMTKPFGKNEEHFKWSLLLVLCKRLVSCSLAAHKLVVSILATWCCIYTELQPEPS